MGKTELALLYFPGSKPGNACRNFNRMISHAVGLLPALEALGYAARSLPAEGIHQTRLLTAQMVRTIVRYCGEP